MKTLLLAAAVVTAGLLAAPPARATEAIAVSVEELARMSDLVIRGRVASAQARFAGEGRRIFTFVEVERIATWRGKAGPRVTVLVPGGEVGRVGQRVDGVPTFHPGAEAVVFLRRAEAGTYRVTGLAQGKFDVAGPDAVPDLSHTTFVANQVRAGERRAEPMALRELERRVRSVK